MAIQGFKLRKNGTSISSFDLPLNIEVVFYCGDDIKRNTPQIAVDPAGASNVLVRSGPVDKSFVGATSVAVIGKVKDQRATLHALINNGSQSVPFGDDLTLTICGSPRKQPGYTVDLLASLALSGDASQIYNYTRILRINSTDDPDQLLAQNTETGKHNCGDVSLNYGRKYLGKPTSEDFRAAYYNPPAKAKGNKMADLTFRPSIIRQAIAKIRALLDTGVSVRVWVLYGDDFGTTITPRDSTHFITIIGHAPDKFLYIDPWPGGSSLTYDGGMYPASEHFFLGELTFDVGKPEKGIHSVKGSAPNTSPGPNMNYRVVAGPA